MGCCSRCRPCDVGGGDCDNNNECAGDLICGSDNCDEFHNNTNPTADCCIEP